MKIKTNKNIGFTLIETMIVVLIMGIVFSAGMPMLQGVNNDSSVENEARKFVSMVALARQTSIKDGVPTYIYPVTEDNNWESGWISYVSSSETTYNLDNPISIDNRNDISAIRFDPRGRVYNGVTLNIINNVEFLFCHPKGGDISGRKIIINFLGKISLEVVEEC
jgi:prepilin-type N-terminal cleavage/methylation domain-containing protein